MWIHTGDHGQGPAFYDGVRSVCLKIAAPTLSFAKVANAESGVSARARNPATNASGLFQLMPINMPGVGWTLGHERFRLLSAVEQLPYFLRFFMPHAGKLGTDAAVYVATFLPAFVDYAADPDYVLVARRGLPDQKLGWAYEANAVFDANNDGHITVGELGAAIRRNWRGQRCAEIERRLLGDVVTPDLTPNERDLTTWWGVQRALVNLGYNLGNSGPKGDGVDGVPGAITRGQLMDFQRKRGLVPDAVAGRLTRPVMQAALAAKGVVV